MDDVSDDPAIATAPLPGDAAHGGRLALARDVSSEVVPLLEETLAVGKRRVATGSLRVTTRTDTRQETAEVELARSVVEVTRVPVDRPVDEAPAVRTEGDTTIVSVVEERFVVVKQLFLKEEMHIRHLVERETSRQPVALRRQRAVIERVDAEGRVVDHAAPGFDAVRSPASD